MQVGWHVHIVLLDGRWKKARHNFVLAGKICCKQWDCGRTPHRELFKERDAGEFGKSSGVAIGVKTATAIS
jgi:hypothetical protein